MVSFTKALMEVMERDMKYKKDKDVVMLKRNGVLTFTDSNFDNLPFQEINNNDINSNWELFEEEDNWNLAGLIDKHCPICTCNNFKEEDVKKFIQKVKEDIDKIHPKDEFTDWIKKINEILDKRAGDL